MAKKRKFIELIKGKDRKEEQKFFVAFSETQLNAILLIILAATFLIQGIIRYLEIINKIELLESWFNYILGSIFFLVLSVVLVSLGGIIAPLRSKRITNVISFLAFLGGFMLFLISLGFLYLKI